MRFVGSSTYYTEILISWFAAKWQVINTHNQLLTDLYNTLLPNLSPKLQHSILLSSSSSWLTTLPLSDHGFSLHNGAFCDALRIVGSLFYCHLCGKLLSVVHLRFSLIRHNEMCDITTVLLSEVCHIVATFTTNVWRAVPL